MNIYRVTVGFPPRKCGWSNHAFFLSKYQAYLGNRVFVLQPHMSKTLNSSLNIYKINLGLFTKYFGFLPIRILFCIKCLFKCLFLHFKYPVDIIHCHGDVIESFIFGLLSRLLKTKIVLTIHSDLNRKKYYKLIAQFMFHFVDAFIVVSESIKVELISLGIDGEKINVISSGIEYEKFAEKKESKINVRKNLGIPSNSVVVIFVGRLHPVKGLKYLIDAFKIMNNKDEILFIIIGDGQERNRLQMQASGINNIIFVGEKSQEEVIKYLHSADVFVLPSIDLPGLSEGTPTAVMEAMAAGLPIITADSGGTKFLIKHGENGLIVKQKNSEELARAISKLVDDPQLRRRMGKINQLSVKEKDWDVIAQKVCQIYYKLIEDSKLNLISDKRK